MNQQFRCETSVGYALHQRVLILHVLKTLAFLLRLNTK
jgi:hypothetical protein